MQELKAIILASPFEWSPEAEALYKLYCDIWDKTWKDLGVEKIDSDDFCRMKVHSGFYIQGRAIAYHGYDFFDLHRACDRRHSYFKRLPPETCDLLAKQGYRRVATMENLAVHPDYRKIEGYSVSDMVGGFSAHYLKGHPWCPDAMLGLVRKDRGIDRMALEHGGVPVIDNLTSYGVPTALMAVPTKTLRESPVVHVRSTVRRLLADVLDQHNITEKRGAA